MFRAGIILKSGMPLSDNFDTLKEAEDWILSIAEKEGIKFYKILNKETGEIVDRGEDI